MNNPIMYADPSGHMPELAQWLIGGALVVGAIAITICTAGAGGALALALGGGLFAGIQYGLTADKIATGISGINNAKTGLSNAWKPLSNIKNFTNMPFSSANIARTVGQAASNYNNAYTAYVLAEGTYEIVYTAAKVLYFVFENLASDLIGLMF